MAEPVNEPFSGSSARPNARSAPDRAGDQHTCRAGSKGSDSQTSINTRTSTDVAERSKDYHKK